MNSDPPRVGLALSGGGFRAAAFHLGVLKRLEELQILHRLSVLSTVSGGSITGGIYALRCAMHGGGAPGSFPVDDLIEEMRPFLNNNLRGRALFGTPLRALRTLLSMVVPSVRRMPLVVNDLDSTLFRGARLGELPPWIVINATSLRTGKSWKFYRDCAGDYLAGVTFNVGEVRIAEAVGASAAYPLLVDPYPFHTRWEDLKQPPKDRWEQPPRELPATFSRWRARYGKPRGGVTIPLVDGGIYDNEGINSLRSSAVTHAIISSTAPPEADFGGGGEFRTLPRTVDVMHSRLGAVTRQWAYEMTHEVNPSAVRDELLRISDRLAGLAAAHSDPDLDEVAERLSALAPVGWPPRGRQFTHIAQILLHRTDIAANKTANYDPPYNIPELDRGLTPDLVEELARVRTDFDAIGDDVLDLLIAQGYFLTDAYTKISAPALVCETSGVTDIGHPSLRPAWPWAHQVMRNALAHPRHTKKRLRAAQSRKWTGRAARTQP